VGAKISRICHIFLTPPFPKDKLDSPQPAKQDQIQNDGLVLSVGKNRSSRHELLFTLILMKAIRRPLTLLRLASHWHPRNNRWRIAVPETYEHRGPQSGLQQDDFKSPNAIIGSIRVVFPPLHCLGEVFLEAQYHAPTPMSLIRRHSWDCCTGMIILEAAPVASRSHGPPHRVYFLK
jgi:hypothetical protein